MNKKIGIVSNGAINYIRHSKISEELRNEIDPIKRVNLSKMMGHSTITQLKYIRLLNEI